MKATNDSISFTYLLIGSGRLARHLGHYFNLLNINFHTWDRSQDPHALPRKLGDSTHVLLAISDSALEGFYRQKLAGHDDVNCIHFSGAMNIEGMISAHPLMTFADEFYDFEFYKKIHFVVTGADNLSDVLPGLPNPYSTLDATQKALYHAYCVMGGNFVTLLTQEMLKGFEKMQIPPAAAKIYLEKTVENALKMAPTALTGPLARKDTGTVDKNLAALEDHHLKNIYQAFLKTYWPEYNQKRELP